jgi:hypothetical protein
MGTTITHLLFGEVAPSREMAAAWPMKNQF